MYAISVDDTRYEYSFSLSIFIANSAMSFVATERFATVRVKSFNYACRNVLLSYLLKGRGTESISRGTAYNVYAEVLSLVNRFAKTKETKSAIVQLQKTVKGMNSASVHK